MRLLILVALLLAAGAGGAAADGLPYPWQLGFQEPSSPVMERVDAVHDLLLWIITLISVFVLALLAVTCWKFRASANATPSKRSHNTVLEIVWTVVPVLILVVIAIPSFRLLYYADTAIEPDMTIKAIGRQWYWTYEYPDHGNFAFDAYIVKDEELGPGDLRLLTTDNAVVLPVGVDVRVLTTASDVLHSWAMPSLGVKKDAVPGRLNETWLRIEEPGMYYGQCSEICGALHGFMPIMIRAVPIDEFEEWVAVAQQEFAKVDDGVAVAAAQ